MPPDLGKEDMTAFSTEAVHWCVSGLLPIWRHSSPARLGQNPCFTRTLFELMSQPPGEMKNEIQILVSNIKLTCFYSEFHRRIIFSRGPEEFLSLFCFDILKFLNYIPRYWSWQMQVSEQREVNGALLLLCITWILPNTWKKGIISSHSLWT